MEVTREMTTDSSESQLRSFSRPDAVVPAPFSAISADSDESFRWKATLERAIQSIVSIRFIITRNFDTWRVGSYSATGFIVDVEKALILTNKHVVTDAPFIGKVCFKNSEEVPAWPVWRDPVHDFGILRFDKSKVQFMDLIAVPLAPDEARVGLAVRVPGSDAGEKLAVLSGIIARIDRPAANYGVGTYCDFNTFYIQASANTSGGSSGSPVIDIYGRAVALNAGGSTQAASSFFLPLARVKRALDLIRQGKKVPRGTLQTEFSQKQYDECRRLGLPMSLESEFRKKSPDLNGILSVKHIIPNGPADGVLMVGDLLIRVNSVLINHFVELAEILDNLAESKSTISLTVFRDGKFIDVTLTVGSLDDITPSRYVEVGGSIVHELSYQMARSYLHPCGGVFVADAGHMLGVAGVPVYAFVTAVAHKKVKTLDDFIRIMSSIPVGRKVPVRYYTLAKKRVEIVKIMIVESLWGRFRLAERDDSTGMWRYTNLSYSSESLAPALSNASFVTIPMQNKHAKLGEKLKHSLCVVEYHSPFGIDGTNTKWADGVGIIYDSQVGLVLVDRSTIPTALGKLYLTFANNVIVPGKIVYIHPIHNYAFVKYDTSFVAGSGLEIVGIELSSLPGLQAGDKCHLVSVNGITHIPRIQSTTVKARGFFLFGDTSPPKFRTMNWDDAISLHKGMTDYAGVLVDDDGAVRAAWLSRPDNAGFLGLSLEEGSQVRQIANYLRKLPLQNSPWEADSTAEARGCKLHVVDVELSETYFWKARELGLSEEWIERIGRRRATIVQSASLANGLSNHAYDVNSTPPERVFKDHNTITTNCDFQEIHNETVNIPPESSDSGDKYTVLVVRRVAAAVSDRPQFYDSDSELEDIETDEPKATEGGLREGDLLLSINDTPLTHISQLMFLEFNNGSDIQKNAEITLLRNAQYKRVRIPTTVLSGTPSVDAVHWAGAVIQPPHRTLWFHNKNIPEGCYVSLLYSGSPAQRDGISACWFIVEVDGKKTPTLEMFLEAVEGLDYELTVPHVNPLMEQTWEDLSARERQHTEYDEDNVVYERRRRGSTLSAVSARRPSISVSVESLMGNARPDGIFEDQADMGVFSPIDTVQLDLNEEATTGLARFENTGFTGIFEGDPEEVGAAAAREEEQDEDVVVKEVEDDDLEEDEDQINNAAVTKSFRVRLMSGELVSKVVTVDVCLASKNYFPTWRCVC